MLLRNFLPQKIFREIFFPQKFIQRKFVPNSIWRKFSIKILRLFEIFVKIMVLVSVIEMQRFCNDDSERRREMDGQSNNGRTVQETNVNLEGSLYHDIFGEA